MGLLSGVFLCSVSRYPYDRFLGGNVKSPLRYPGGKTRAAKYIATFVPRDATELCSPFLGGGSVELTIATRGTKVYGYDLFQPLVCFWTALLADNTRLAEFADAYRTTNEEGVRGLTKKDFIQFKSDLREKEEYSHEYAAKFYALNRSSFSGATLSAGYSKRAAYKRFTDSSIERIRNFNVDNFKVGCLDFKESIPKHPDAFLYCDPPYMLEKNNNLYGNRGSTHLSFDHEGLFTLLNKRKGWLLSYNNSPQIREMYKDYEIFEAHWAYGMKNVSTKTMGSSSEILIIG